MNQEIIGEKFANHFTHYLTFYAIFKIFVSYKNIFLIKISVGHAIVSEEWGGGLRPPLPTPVLYKHAMNNKHKQETRKNSNQTGVWE